MITSQPSKDSIKIVASDLDGTLLAPNHQLSAYTKQTLKELHQHGYTFVFATGRHHIDVAGIREQVGIPAYMITSNGARVHDTENKVLYSKNVPEDLIQPVIDVVKEYSNIYINLYRNDDWMLSRDDAEIREFHAESGFQYTLFDDNQAPTDGVAKIFFTHPDRDHEAMAVYERKLREKFADKLSIAFSSPWCLEVMGAAVSKGDALNMVTQSLNLGLENTIAFGDGMNDVEMLSMAGKGLVMGTAHPSVFKALPNIEVIGSNENDAVAHYLRTHLL